MVEELQVLNDTEVYIKSTNLLELLKCMKQNYI